MPAFIFMLTRDDRTVPDALDVFRRVRDVPDLRYVGFKDVGLPLDQLKRLAAEIRDAGQAVLLEVVSLSEADELNSARGAVDIGVDYLLGGTRPEKVIPLLAGSGIRYFPFCGRTIGHPTQLRGTVEEIVADAARLAAMPGVSGMDLLAYRYECR
jgi:4-hydroxythreonine-4-phosphate dehydrogenase